MIVGERGLSALKASLSCIVFNSLFHKDFQKDLEGCSTLQIDPEKRSGQAMPRVWQGLQRFFLPPALLLPRHGLSTNF